jgi:hypothetical protein
MTKLRVLMFFSLHFIDISIDLLIFQIKKIYGLMPSLLGLWKPSSSTFFFMSTLNIPIWALRMFMPHPTWFWSPCFKEVFKA